MRPHRILLVGNGAREHAICDAVLAHNDEIKFYAFMSARNPGIARACEEFAVGDIHNPADVAKWAAARRIELAICSPDAVLAAGVSDALWKAGIPTVGPVRAAARLEWDKAFARELMARHRITGCPKFKVCRTPAEAAEFIEELGGAVAVKPAGLTGGKGVKVVGYQLKDAGEAKEYAKEILAKRIGQLECVVIEEKLEGEEFTLQAFVDGKKVVGMPAVQDHKRAWEGDVGPNTGGMGSYSDAGRTLPFMRQADYEQGLAIMQHAVDALRKEGIAFQGFLYGQFMLTRGGVCLVEFNSRLGDPEAMNVLPILKSDFVELLQQITEGKLGRAEFERKATVCKYLVPAGYPENPRKNEPITVMEHAIAQTGARYYYASVDERDGVIYTSSSRAVALLGIADTIGKAEEIAERACSFVKGPLYHRRDIGKAELIQKRIEHMRVLRG
ncbi:MAG: phosphoribosylamine--glycine ligase [Candidatus Micrarchaeia archaeon]